MTKPKPSVRRAAEKHVQAAAHELGVEDLVSIRWFDGPIIEPDGGETWGYVLWSEPTVINLCKSMPFALVAQVAAHEVHHCWEYVSGNPDFDEEAAYDYCGRYVEKQRGIEVTAKLYESLDLDALPEAARQRIEELITDNIEKATQLRENEEKIEVAKAKLEKRHH